MFHQTRPDTSATVFGFAAALIEGLPIIGLAFTISNRIGAAMWAHGEYIIHLTDTLLTCLLV